MGVLTRTASRQKVGRRKGIRHKKNKLA